MSSSDRNRNAPSVPPTPVPLAKISLLGMILLANNASIWMIFSFLPFMVSNFFPSLPTTELGFEAGILGSAFSCGGLIGNFVSGVISDRIGRRPALLWGLLGTAISSLCFGFSPTFWFAVTSRFMWGVLNGNIGVAKTYLAEISDDTNLSRGMAYFGVIGSIGRVIGPIIGGLLSYPAETIPSVFRGTAFDKFPFALPSMVISVNCLIMFVVTYFWLPETLPAKTVHLSDGEASGTGSRSTRREGLQYSALLSEEDCTTDSAVGSSTDDNVADVGVELKRVECGGVVEEGEKTNNPLLPQTFVPLQREAKRMSGDTDREDSDVDGEPRLGGQDSVPNKESVGTSVSEKARRSRARREVRRSISFSSLVKVKVIDLPHISYQGLKQVAANEVPVGMMSDVERDLEAGREAGEEVSPQQEEGPESPLRSEEDSMGQSLLPSVRYSNGAEFFESVDVSKKSLALNLAYLMRQKQVVVSTTLYGLSSFVVVVGNEIFTLWVVTSRADGGLNYNTQQIGVAVMICGVIGTALQLTLYPYASEKLGVLGVHRWGGLMFALNSMFIPCISYISLNETVTMTIVVLALTMQSVAATWYLVSTFVLISNSCYSHQLATVNGIGQTCASLGRLSGPYLGSVLFAWSETNGLEWPFNQFLVYYVLTVLAVIIYQYSFLLPKSIQRRKREPKFRNWDDADAHYRRELELERVSAAQQPSIDEDSSTVSRLGGEAHQPVVVVAAPGSLSEQDELKAMELR